MSIKLTQPQVLELLAELHRVDPGRPTAIRGRFSAFQQLGIPKGANTGRGRPATYAAPQLFEVLLAFEFLQLGMAPERIAWLLTGAGTKTLLRRVAQQAARHFYRSVLEPRSKDEVFLHLDPAAFTIGAGKDATVRGDVEIILPGTTTDIIKALGARRRCWINVSELLSEAMRVAVHLGFASGEEWTAAFIAEKVLTTRMTPPT